MGAILEVKQPAGKAGEVLDGTLDEKIGYWVCIAYLL